MGGRRRGGAPLADTVDVEVALLVVAGVLGLCVGSFLNVVIWRVPRRASVVRPSSQCPGCGRRLARRDLVPVLSWVVLRGRCRTCGGLVSVRYPAVELATGLLFVLVTMRFGLTWPLPAYLVLTSALVALAVIDVDTMRLPRGIIHVAGLVGAVLLAGAALALGAPDRILTGAAGALLAFALFAALHAASPRWMGYGDVRLAALIGGYLGWLGLALVPVGLFLGFLLGAVTGVALIGARRLSRRAALPFGPFLATGALAAVLAGEPLVRVWLGSV